MSERGLQAVAEAAGEDELSGYLDLLAAISQDFAMSLDVDETLRLSLTRIMDYLDARRRVDVPARKQ